MKQLLITAIFLTLFICPLYAAEEGAKQLEDAFVKAFEANDIEAVMALYAPDASLFPPDAQIAKGKDAIRANYAGFMNNFTIKTLKITDRGSETHGDTSCGWGQFELTMVPKAGGEEVHMNGRFTEVVKKIHGKWLYMVDHASVPLAPPPAEGAQTQAQQ